jgi:hypothetical protein
MRNLFGHIDNEHLIENLPSHWQAQLRACLTLAVVEQAGELTDAIELGLGGEFCDKLRETVTAEWIKRRRDDIEQHILEQSYVRLAGHG